MFSSIFRAEFSIERFIIYHLLGLKSCLETIVLLSLNSSNTAKNCLNLITLKKLYKEFLHHLQPKVPLSNSVEIEFVNDSSKCKDLSECFNLNLKAEGIDNLIELDIYYTEAIDCIIQSLDKISDLEPHFSQLFKTAINFIFCGESTFAVGGTTSAAIGVIWGNPNKDWSLGDYFEYFIHEMTHTLMFLDELRYQHYKNVNIIHEKENFSVSAILSVERPEDRVLHSIVVATEVLLLRQRNLTNQDSCKVHTQTTLLMESTSNSIESLLSHPNVNDLLTSRSINLIDMCKMSIQEMASELVQV